MPRSPDGAVGLRAGRSGDLAMGNRQYNGDAMVGSSNAAEPSSSMASPNMHRRQLTPPPLLAAELTSHPTASTSLRHPGNGHYCFLFVLAAEPFTRAFSEIGLAVDNGSSGSRIVPNLHSAVPLRSSRGPASPRDHGIGDQGIDGGSLRSQVCLSCREPLI